MEEGEGEKEELGWTGRGKKEEEKGEREQTKKITRLVHGETKMSMRKSHMGMA